jgi:hypothetical protein
MLITRKSLTLSHTLCAFPQMSGKPRTSIRVWGQTEPENVRLDWPEYCQLEYCKHDTYADVYRSEHVIRAAKWTDPEVKILVAIDSSAPSQLALEEVAARPWPSGSEVCVFNVVESGLVAEPISSIREEGAP